MQKCLCSRCSALLTRVLTASSSASRRPATQARCILTSTYKHADASAGGCGTMLMRLLACLLPAAPPPGTLLISPIVNQADTSSQPKAPCSCEMKKKQGCGTTAPLHNPAKGCQVTRRMNSKMRECTLLLGGAPVATTSAASSISSSNGGALASLSSCGPNGGSFPRKSRISRAPWTLRAHHLSHLAVRATWLLATQSFTELAASWPPKLLCVLTLSSSTAPQGTPIQPEHMWPSIATS